MKDKFTLSCKIIGLLLTCYSIIAIIVSVPALIFLKQQTNEIIKMAQNPMLADFANSAKDTFTFCLLMSSVLSVGPFCLGIYLMRSGKLFINFACPESQTKQTEEIVIEEPQLDLKPKTAKDDDSRFMPPGMR